MPSNKVIFHIIYIHGFRGDHTTFQSFPSDLHRALLPTIPAHVELRSLLYPTYKSKRPIAVATEKFLGWLETLPAGPVILCGHSMGGLLAAEAATSPGHPVSRRVVALLGCDVPFLGMHPHVVISGIASLLPHKADGKGRAADVDVEESAGRALKTEKEMNDSKHVVVVPPEDISRTPSPSPNASKTSLPQPLECTPVAVASSSPTLSPPPPLPPRPTTARRRPPSPSRPTTVKSRILHFIHSHSEDPLVKFISRHRSESVVTAATRWVIETFEFGICMFDPKGLKERYAALEGWTGDWVVFWTRTVPRGDDDDDAVTEEGEGVRDVEIGKGGEGDEKQGLAREEEDTASLAMLLEGDADATSSPLHSPTTSTTSLEPVIPSSPSGLSTKPRHDYPEEKWQTEKKLEDKVLKFYSMAEKKLRETEIRALLKQRHKHSPHHFVVRPFQKASGLAHRWEQVLIRGAKDEVEAHCGLFLKDLNLEYEIFVRRVANVVKGWVEKCSDVNIDRGA